jgi:spore germination protein YaaH
VAKFTSGSGGDDFDGLTSQAIADQTHALGMKCTPLVFGGAANSGTDQGIQNILNDSPKGAQKSFIDAMVAEAVSKGYDGYDLDWEVDGGTDYAKYGKPLEAFLAAFDGALAAKGKTLSLIVGTWFMKQSDCSGGTGLVDLAAVAPLVDQIIIMDYTPTLGSPAKICDSSVKPAVACNGDFGNAFDWMCADVPLEKISIGLDSDPKNGNNPSAGDTMAAIGASGVRNVAIWPEDNGGAGGYRLCDDTGIAPSSATWFGLFSEFLSKP